MCEKRELQKCGVSWSCRHYEEKHMNVEEGEKRLYKRRITVREKAFAKH